MKTASLVKLNNADRSVESIVNYNTQGYKTEGSWPLINQEFQQRDLLSFHGMSNLPGLTLHQQALLFKRQLHASVRYGMQRAGVTRRLSDWSECHTLVQSFDYHANLRLSPKTAHQMGDDLFRAVQQYLWQAYHYRLDNGMISTHIDDNRNRVTNDGEHKMRETHLHSHIVLPSYNANGQPIYPYLRESNIYDFQHLNDSIVDGPTYRLHDYYFLKLWRQIIPLSAYTLQRNHRNGHYSNTELALKAFKQANDYAWDRDRPMRNDQITLQRFKQTLHDRNNFLCIKYQFRSKIKTDIQNGQKHMVFKLADFKMNSSLRQQEINIRDMHVLRWRNVKEMRTERLLWQFSFKGLLNKPVSFNAYQATVSYAIHEVPPIEELVSPILRQKSRCNLASAYHKVAPYLKRYYHRTKRYAKNSWQDIENCCGRALRHSMSCFGRDFIPTYYAQQAKNHNPVMITNDLMNRTYSAERNRQVTEHSGSVSVKTTPEANSSRHKPVRQRKREQPNKGPEL